MFVLGPLVTTGPARDGGKDAGEGRQGMTVVKVCVWGDLAMVPGP